MMNVWIILSLAIVSEVIGTSALKLSDGFTKLVPSLVVLVGYGLAFYLLSLTLKQIPVGVAYAIWAGAGIALITLIGWILFKQTLDLAALLGIALIISGVVVLQVFSKVGGH
jgi:small multidrug resistance pump